MIRSLRHLVCPVRSYVPRMGREHRISWGSLFARRKVLAPSGYVLILSSAIRLFPLTIVGVLIGGLIVTVAFAADTLPAPAQIGLPLEKVNGTFTPVVIIIREAIKYVGVLAIMSLSWGGIQFLVSIGEEGKVKKAKSIVLYSLLGVILSITAYTIIDIVNSLSINVQ